jgi:hypothetical protein
VNYKLCQFHRKFPCIQITEQVSTQDDDDEEDGDDDGL